MLQVLAPSCATKLAMARSPAAGGLYSAGKYWLATLTRSVNYWLLLAYQFVLVSMGSVVYRKQCHAIESRTKLTDKHICLRPRMIMLCWFG